MSAVTAGEGETAVANLWALGKDAIGLLNAFAMERLKARYWTQVLETIAVKLLGMAEA